MRTLSREEVGAVAISFPVRARLPTLPAIVEYTAHRVCEVVNGDSVNTSDLIARVNKNLALLGAEFVPDSGSATPNPTTIHGTLNGSSVRLEFTVGNEHADYDHAVWLYSASGEPLGRGNGGPSFEEAIDIYQWNGAVADLGS